MLVAKNHVNKHYLHGNFNSVATINQLARTNFKVLRILQVAVSSVEGPSTNQVVVKVLVDNWQLYLLQLTSPPILYRRFPFGFFYHISIYSDLPKSDLIFYLKVRYQECFQRESPPLQAHHFRLHVVTPLLTVVHLLKLLPLKEHSQIF